MNREAIEAAIPHRAPFLFLDRVVDRTESSIVCEWTVPADADWFRGHFPGTPVTPGVLLSEHTFQAAAVLISLALGGFADEDGVPVLTKVADARFRRRVSPGERLTTRVEVEERVGPAWYCKARTTCGDETVLRIRFALSATGAMARIAK